jgi:hypothetical protein
MMTKLTLKATLTVKKTGQEIVVSTSTREVPDLSTVDSSEFASAFNYLETAVIENRQHIEKETVQKIMEEASKNKIDEALAKLSLEERAKAKIAPTPYTLDAEIGTIQTTAYRLTVSGETIMNTASELFIKTGSREKWRSGRFDELLFMTGTELSYRKTADLLNRIRGGADEVIPTTVRNQLEHAGHEIMSTIESISEEALASVGCDDWNNSPSKPINSFDDSYYMDFDAVANAARELNVKHYNASEYEAPELTANISVDDVVVKGQNTYRPMPDA